MKEPTCPGIIERQELSIEKEPENSLDGYCYSAGKGMWYYDVFSEPMSGPTVYRGLLVTAKQRIDVWDPYLHPMDAYLFTDIPASIDLRILTCFGAKPKDLQNNNFSSEYKGFIDVIKQIQSEIFFGLKIAIINSFKCSKFGSGKLPHDRFLFIDKQAYLIGSSLEYHAEESRGNWITSVKNTTIYKVTDKENQEILYKSFLNFWNDNHKYHREYVDVLVDIVGGVPNEKRFETVD